ncbi:hypothetical protein VQ056_16460 [Paenibacillus sp. JTLBN-2024]
MVAGTGRSARKRRNSGRSRRPERKHRVSTTKKRSSVYRGGTRRDPWLRRAASAGWEAGNAAPPDSGASAFHASALQQSFAEWMNESIKEKPGYARMKRLSEAYAQGYSDAAGRKDRGIPLRCAAARLRWCARAARRTASMPCCASWKGCRSGRSSSC